MKILIIGGTKFLGRHLVAAACARQHEVTLFHRGSVPAAGLPPVVEIYGDRNVDLGRLGAGHWDAVIDTCGYLPQAVRASAAALWGRVGQYVFISSVSAYASFRHPGYSETAPLAALTPAQAVRALTISPAETTTAAALGDLYGPLKAACEQEVRQVFGTSALLVRPGLLVGPHDPTDRFTYWVRRVARGGAVLAPGSPGRFVQLLDARDLAEWVIGAVERRLGGPYNVAGPPFALTFGGLLDALQTTTQGPAAFQWVEEAFLQRENVAPWSELPLYLPESDPETAGFLSANIDKALAAQLSFRPFSATILDTLAWRATQSEPLRAGLAPARERALLAQYQRR